MQKPDIIAEVEKCRLEDGRLIPADVVERARPSENPLHSYFDWDDSVAGEQWRLQQARQLIRVLVTIDPVTQRKMQVNVSLHRDRHAGNGYRSLVAVLQSEESREALLEDARRDLRAFRNRYNRLHELAEVISAIDQFVEQKEPSVLNQVVASPAV